MLSQKARPYIEASVPVLREHGVTITRTFYSNMFAEFPEFTHLFNMGNQANGSQQQSLASAVFAYAVNIDNADALAPVISRIAHKHASVGITAEHYPIVGRHLLGAIKQTLGDAATPELIDAWAEAYGLLADTLIDAEKKLYAERETRPGALTPLTVVKVTPQTDLVTSFTLVRTDGGPAWDFKPGQYISVAVQLPDGPRQLRQYSLSDAPGKKTLRISVKREPAGKETPAGRVSNWLHDNLRPCDALPAAPPFGDFAPDTTGDDPIVLLSGGIGITPMISALNHIRELNPNRTVLFGHATRSPKSFAHRADVEAAQAEMPNLTVATFFECLGGECGGGCKEGASATAGFMDIEKLPAWSYADTNVYICGPLAFMEVQRRKLLELGVPIARLHREVFGPELLGHLQ
ncbi:MAG TPA: globin domain-containing protein [Armatimonadaceae bacterium]|nr:globin domain-containing protein [Armatimonadaceae bacterium]